MNHKQRLANTAIRSLFNAALLTLPAFAITWVVLGHAPQFWQLYLASEALEITIRIIFWLRKRQQIRNLQAAYDRPAYGDQ